MPGINYDSIIDLPFTLIQKSLLYYKTKKYRWVKQHLRISALPLETFMQWQTMHAAVVILHMEGIQLPHLQSILELGV